MSYPTSGLSSKVCYVINLLPRIFNSIRQKHLQNMPCSLSELNPVEEKLNEHRSIRYLCHSANKLHDHESKLLCVPQSKQYDTKRTLRTMKEIMDEYEKCPKKPKHKVFPWQVPCLIPKDCPVFPPDCPKPPPIEPPPLVPLRRLIPTKILQRPIPCPIEKCPPRADAHYKIKMKELPVMPKGNCECKNLHVPKKLPPLLRLRKRPAIQPNICPTPEPCPPRADGKIIVKPKKLRQITPGKCTPKPIKLKKGKPLQRLVRRFVPLPRIICVEPYCPPDPVIKVPPKTLPYLKPNTCPCIPDPPLNEGEPLKRLTKRFVCPPWDECKEEEPCPIAADKLCHVEVKPKKLKTMLLAKNEMSVEQYYRKNKNRG